MTLNLEIINPLHKKSWNDFVVSTDAYSIFHSSEWAKVLVNTYKYVPYYFVLTENSMILSMIPFMEVNSIITGRRAISLPFSDQCTPIIHDKNEARELFKRIILLGKKFKWRCLDFHGGEDLFQYSPFHRFYGHCLSLSEDTDRIFSRLRGNTRRNIKKAKNSGVEIRMGNSMETLKQFYRLHCLTRKRHKLPAQPFDFFKNIYDSILSNDLGYIFCASYRGDIVGAAIFFHFGTKAIFKFGASNMMHQNLRMNNLIMWEAIKWYSVNQYKTMSFGRTDFLNEGLRRYKNGWGANEYIIKYFRYDLMNNVFVIGNPGIRDNVIKLIFAKMPISVSRIIAKILYKHFA